MSLQFSRRGFALAIASLAVSLCLPYGTCAQPLPPKRIAVLLVGIMEQSEETKAFQRGLRYSLSFL